MNIIFTCKEIENIIEKNMKHKSSTILYIYDKSHYN